MQEKAISAICRKRQALQFAGKSNLCNLQEKASSAICRKNRISTPGVFLRKNANSTPGLLSGANW